MTATQEIQIRALAWDHADAVALRDAMTTELSPRHADRAMRLPLPPGMAVQPAEVVYAGVAYLTDQEHGIQCAAGHIALRHLPGTIPALDGRVEAGRLAELEVKRMFVVPSARGRGIARLLLAAAEEVAAALRAQRLVLQTGDRQPEAATLYASAGYTRIPVFEPYLTLPYSLCFEKVL